MLVRTMGAVSAVLMLMGCSAFGSNESERYRDKLALSGFREVGAYFDTSATAYFVGPADADITAVASGPQLVVKKDGQPMKNGVQQTVALGTGYSTDTGNCDLLFWSIDASSAVSVLQDWGKLTSTEKAGLDGGTLIGIEVDVICNAQADK
ncbi:hypothetical protein ACQPZX_34955 [Actinoplanes sp. CA-142083]|uniref:hypothetical protein n=1 Tax=Actinoplanes sp. CA-142083 TaxID=3239903 RepID=UPI003D937451